MKSKKAQLTLGGIVMVIMVIFVCLAIANEVFNQQNVMTDKQNVINETLSVASARATTAGNINETAGNNFTIGTVYPTGDWRYNDCKITMTTVNNGTLDLTANTDYRFNDNNSRLTFYNTTNTVGWTLNTSYLTYTFCEEGYNKDGGSRSIAGLIGLFAVIALLVWVGAYGLREWMS